ncbi:hypothetical protein COB55_04485 [Candidatus Wolfebacteria bacterium]|nr:MAG: hypothetical protein COB55_04485 [Candidatus Wolfebacteria bacterium]
MKNKCKHKTNIIDMLDTTHFLVQGKKCTKCEELFTVNLHLKFDNDKVIEIPREVWVVMKDDLRFLCDIPMYNLDAILGIVK